MAAWLRMKDAPCDPVRSLFLPRFEPPKELCEPRIGAAAVVPLWVTAVLGILPVRLLSARARSLGAGLASPQRSLLAGPRRLVVQALRRASERGDTSEQSRSRNNRTGARSDEGQRQRRHDSERWDLHNSLSIADTDSIAAPLCTPAAPASAHTHTHTMARVAGTGVPGALPPPLPARPYTAPASRPRVSLSGLGDGFVSSPAKAGSGAFIHRDIFAPHQRSSLPPTQPALGDLGASGSGSGAGAASRTPQRSRSREEPDSIIPSASKLQAWDKKLGKYPLLGWLEAHTGIRKLYSASALLVAFCALVFKGVGMGLFTVLVGFLYPLHMSLKTIENCTGLFEEITGDNRGRHTEQELREKREEIIGQLRKWSQHTRTPHRATRLWRTDAGAGRSMRAASGAWRSSASLLLLLCSFVLFSPPAAVRLVYWVVYGLFSTFESLGDTALSWLPVYHPLKLLFLLWCFLPSWQGSQLVFDILVRPVLVRHEQAIEHGVHTAHQAAVFSAQRIGRSVRANSIQLSQALITKGMGLVNQVRAPPSAGALQSSGAADAPAAPVSGGSHIVRDRVASIESVERRLSDISEFDQSRSRGGSHLELSRVASSSAMDNRAKAVASIAAKGAGGDYFNSADEGQQEGVSNLAFEAAGRVAQANQR